MAKITWTGEAATRRDRYRLAMKGKPFQTTDPKQLAYYRVTGGFVIVDQKTKAVASPPPLPKKSEAAASEKVLPPPTGSRKKARSPDG